MKSAAIVAVTKKHGAALKVIFENDFLPEDKYKIKLCEICSDSSCGICEDLHWVWVYKAGGWFL